jgi:ATP-binding cassette subfamily B protein
MKKIKFIGAQLVSGYQAIKSDLKTFFVNTVRLTKITKEFHKLYWLTGFVVLIGSLLPYLESLALGSLIENLTNNSNSVWYYGLIVMVLGLLIGLFSTIQYYLKLCLDRNLFQFLASYINRRVASLPLIIHEDKKKKDLITKSQESGMWYATEFMQRFPYLLQNAIKTPLSLILISFWSWQVSLVLTLVAIPRFLISFYHNNRLWKISNEVSSDWRLFWYARGTLIDHKQLTEVKLYQNVNYFADRMNTLVKSIFSNEIKAEKAYLLLQIPTLIIFEAGSVFAVFTFIKLQQSGLLNIGQLSSAMAIIILYRLSLAELIQNLGSQFRDGKIVSDVFQAFDFKDEAKCNTAGIKLTEPIETIYFENVWFKYPFTDQNNETTNTSNWVLKDFTLSIETGTTLGLVAPNGSGKTTLMKLLCKLYAPSHGRILINGINLNEIDTDWWQTQVGIMLQDFSHYESLELGEALNLGNTNIGSSQEDWERACRMADALDLVKKLPYGFKTTIGKGFHDETGRDSEFSGGQHQKIAIARLILRNAQIAIFDEPTSALDGDAENRVFQSIYEELNGIRIVVSHRLSTLKRADKIVVIADGRVKEEGQHLELMQTSGIYQTLFERQASHYDA